YCMSITNSTIRVYQALLRMEERFRGNVVPSYEMIAEWATVSRATVARALNALTSIGLLARLRRYVHTVTEDGARSEQT
ncbi:helix-turn-helix domain-containing protein, partial [Escherichia coli]